MKKILWKRLKLRENGKPRERPKAEEMKAELLDFLQRSGGARVKLLKSGWLIPNDPPETLPAQELAEFCVHELHKSADGSRVWGLGSTPGWNGWRYVHLFTVKVRKKKGE